MNIAPISLVDLDITRAEFDRCWPWLWGSLCEFGPTHNKEQIWFLIYNSRAFLWPGKNCAILGELIDHPIGFRSFSYWLQGGDLEELLAMHPDIEQWALMRGCHRAMRRGREGWVRVMEGDWKKGVTLATKWLMDPPPPVARAKRR